MTIEETNLASDLKALRDWLGLSQLKMAVAVGATPAAYITWEGGIRKPRPNALNRIQHALKRFKAIPQPRTKSPRLPFPFDLIPQCCGFPAKSLPRRYSR